MRPFTALPANALAEVLGVASDLDDTLTVHGALHPEAVVALHALSRAGVPVVLATGRPVGWAEVLARLLPVRAVVAENGAAWVLREASGVRAAFRCDAPTRDAQRRTLDALVATLSARFPVLRRVEDWTVRATDVALDVGERARVPRPVVDEACAWVRAQGLHAIASSVHMHVSVEAPDKVLGLQRALQDLGLDSTQLPTKWVYVGDSPNDAGPFGALALAVGVRGVEAYTGRMTMPPFTTEGGAGEGFVEVARAVLGARGEVLW
ncbi:MAG: HAD-IIB family hydrolase [Deltaproteobacteria bacterium]|nr:HAD-IIB family hydrolase [Deltaproteobacteria bacterium]